MQACRKDTENLSRVQLSKATPGRRILMVMVVQSPWDVTEEFPFLVSKLAPYYDR
jgi:hypothetical protein